jgi:hypothetical protein
MLFFGYYLSNIKPSVPVPQCHARFFSCCFWSISFPNSNFSLNQTVLALILGVIVGQVAAERLEAAGVGAGAVEASFGVPRCKESTFDG